MNVPAKINLAMQLVMTAFAEKIRIGNTSIPASTHSLRVGLSLITYDYLVEIVLGGFCHDLLEDTEVAPQMIKRMFGDRVLFLTEACTINPTDGKTEGKRALYDRVVTLARDGEIGPLIIKCADCIDNLRTNYTLKAELQIGAYERGLKWLEAGNCHMESAWLVSDLKSTIKSEERRLTLAGVFE